MIRQRQMARQRHSGLTVIGKFAVTRHNKRMRSSCGVKESSQRHEYVLQVSKECFSWDYIDSSSFAASNTILPGILASPSRHSSLISHLGSGMGKKRTGKHAYTRTDEHTDADTDAHKETHTQTHKLTQSDTSAERHLGETLKKTNSVTPQYILEKSYFLRDL